MASWEESIANLPSEQWDSLRLCVERFEEAWNQQDSPGIAPYLQTAGALRLPVLTALVQIDMERRSEREETPRVETYLDEFPELRESPTIIAELAATEYALRRSKEAELSLDEYSARFPALAPLISERLANLGPASTLARRTAASDTGKQPDRHSLSPVPTRLPAIAGYEVLAHINSGGMGSVYKARDLKLDRLVAIKLPRRELVDDADGRERFLREARSAAKLRHPNICPIHEIGEVEGCPYIAMGFIAGPTLRERTQRLPPTARAAAEVIARLARAVEDAHQHGVVHRDIKPANVLIESESGEPILTDFGLAMELAGADARMTQTGQLMGTPAYMAPEQAAGDIRSLGPAVDIYALGAMLYELLCGRPPFEGSVGEILSQLQNTEPVSPRKRAPRLHRDIETICLKAISKFPKDRYESAAALADDLERFVAGEAILARPPGLARQVVRRLGRSPVATTAVAISLAVILITGMLAIASGQQQRRLNQLREQLDRQVSQLDEVQEAEFQRQLESLEQLAGQIGALEPAEKEKAAAQVTDGLRTAIERRLNVERLAETEPAALRALIGALQQRDATAGKRLSRRLAVKLAGWDIVPALDGGPPELAQVFPAKFQVAADKDALIRRPFATNVHFSNVASSRVPVSSNFRVEAEFANAWESSDEFGVVLGSAQGHTGEVVALDVSHDGNYLASAARDETAIVWDLQQRRLVASRHGRGGINKIAFGQDGRLLAICQGGQLYFYDWRKDSVIATFKAFFFRVSADRQLLAAFDGHQIRIHSLTTGEELCAIANETTHSTGMHLLGNDRQTLATAELPANVVIWDWTTGEVQRALSLADGIKVSALALSETAQLIAVGTEAGEALLFNLADGAPAGSFAHEERVHRIEFSPDGKTLVTLFGDGRATIWDLESRQPRFEARPTEWGLNNLQFGNGGQLLLGTDNRCIMRWEMATGKKLTDLTGHFSNIRTIVANDSPAWIASGGEDRRIQLQEADSGRLMAVLGADHCSVRLRVTDRGAQPEVMLRLGLLGTTVASQRIPLETTDLGQPIRLRVERIHGLIRVWLNAADDGAKPAFEFHEVLPAPTHGTLAILWPRDVRVAELHAYQRQRAAAAQRIDFAEKFHAEGRYEAAAELFHAVAVSLEDEQDEPTGSLWQEVIYKEAVCWQAANKEPAALALFKQLREAPGDRWPVYALVQLWAISLRERNQAEADPLLAEIKKRGLPFSQVAALIPTESRAALIAAATHHLSTIDSFYRYAPNRTAQLEQLCELEELLQGNASSLTRLRLIQAYRMNGDRTTAIKRIEAWIEESDAPQHARAHELAWMLRLEGRVDEAARWIDRCLALDAGKANSRHWIDRAYIEVARGDKKGALRTIDAYLAATSIGGLDAPRAFLLKGFLLHDDGQTEAAQQAWSAGFAAARVYDGRNHAHKAMYWLFYSLLASLSDEGDEADIQKTLQSLLGNFGSNTPVALGLQLLTASPGGQRRLGRACKQMWKTERGMNLARGVAYQQISFQEIVRDPALLLASHVTASLVRPAGLSGEEEAMAWQLTKGFHDAIVLDNSLGNDRLAALAAGQLSPAMLPAAAEKFRDMPEIGGPLSYFVGLQLLQKSRPDLARKCFSMAMQTPMASDTLIGLAKAELAKLDE